MGSCQNLKRKQIYTPLKDKITNDLKEAVQYEDTYINGILQPSVVLYTSEDDVKKDSIIAK